MEFYDVVNERYSYRKYTSKEIPKESLMRIADAVNLAPTACNLQPFEVWVITNKELLERVATVYKRDWLKTAPAIAVILGNPEQAWKRPEGESIIEVDAGIVMEHFVLAAQAEGLGTCWICAYYKESLNEILGVQKPWTTLAMSPIGYPEKVKAEDDRPERKNISEIFKIIE